MEENRSFPAVVGAELSTYTAKNEQEECSLSRNFKSVSTRRICVSHGEDVGEDSGVYETTFPLSGNPGDYVGFVGGEAGLCDRTAKSSSGPVIYFY